MRKFKLLLAVCGGALLFVAGCPNTMPPPPPPAEFGAIVRDRLNDADDAEPIDIADDDEFDTEDETDEFADVLSEPAFD